MSKFMAILPSDKDCSNHCTSPIMRCIRLSSCSLHIKSTGPSKVQLLQKAVMLDGQVLGVRLKVVQCHMPIAVVVLECKEKNFNNVIRPHR